MEINKLEQAIGYKFQNHNILAEALTHPSLRKNQKKIANYERMEFLGDSILGFIISDILFKRFPSYDEGKLARIKAYLVSCEILVEVAHIISLADYIFMAYGEEKSGGRSNNHNLENVVESLIAAIYLDSDISSTYYVVQKLWQNYISQEFDLGLLDPKSSLQAITQNIGLKIPLYEVVERSGVVHSPTFTVKVTAGPYTQIAQGSNIKEAEKAAAKKLLLELRLVFNKQLCSD